MHVPKTSGVAIIQGLGEALNADGAAVNGHVARRGLERCVDWFGKRAAKAATGRPKILTGFDRSLYGDFDRFDTFDQSIRTQMHLEDLPGGATAVAGHFAYSTLRRASAAAPIFTILREPVCRLLSHWLFWRQHTEAQLLPLGLWAARVREARRPLAEFLRSPTVACQTDNIVIRMLLWPHHLVPADDFINPAHDSRLLAEARARLGTFAHVDVFENPNLAGGLAGLIGRSIAYRRRNEACAPTHETCCDLDRHLTPEAWDLLAERSRLDLFLWNDAAMNNVSGTCAYLARRAAIEGSIARYRKLLRGHAAGRD